MRQLGEGLRRVLGLRATFAPETDLVELYLEYLERRRFSARTIRNYRLDIRLAEREMVKPLPAVTKADLDAYMATLHRRGLKSSTIRRKQATIRGFFKWATKEGAVAGNPAAHLEAPKGEERIPIHLERDQVATLLASLKEEDALDLRDATIVRTLYYTGMRASELVGLNVESIRLEEGWLVVFGKGSKERKIPICRELREALEKWLAYHPTGRGAVFCTLAAPYRRLTYDRVYRTVRRSLERAGLGGQGFSCHKLRHTFATRLVNQGMGIEKIQKLLGHRRIDTTTIYAHAEIGDGVRDALDGSL